MSKKHVKELKIMIDANGSSEPFPLKYSLIHNPFAGDMDATKKMNEYPYFTEKVPYPKELLEGKSYNELLHIFFNKDQFIKVVVNNQKLTDKSDIITIEQNIMIMLSLLFPTKYPTSNNINTSYKKYLLKTPYELKFDMGELTRGVPGFTNAATKSEYSYLKINGKVNTVSEIVWLNDVLNEPVYKELINKLIEYNEWVNDTIPDIQEEKQNVGKKLVDGLTPGSKKSIRITQSEIDVIKKQKQIFTRDEFENEVKTMLKSDDTKIQELFELIDEQSRNRSEITKTKFDSIFKNISMAENKKDELLKNAYALFKKYMNSKELLERSRSFSDIKEFDENINKLIINIEALNGKFEETLVETLQFDDDIINRIQVIGTLFEKIKKNDNSNDFKQLAIKINEMVKISNELKALLLVNKYILSNKNSIFVHYDTKIENENDKKIFIGELEKKKYEPFKNIVNTINTLFVKKNRQSMNPVLQKMMNEYFNFTGTEFKKNIIDPVQVIQKEKPDFDDKWNVSVALFDNETDVSMKSCEIYVYMELIEGEMNSSNSGDVSCGVLDEKLTEMFKELTSNEDSYNVPSKPVDVSEINSKPATPVAQPVSKSDAPIAVAEKISGGDDIRKKRESRKRVRRNKKTRKIQRRYSR
jgi:hypothetical protein